MQYHPHVRGELVRQKQAALLAEAERDRLIKLARGDHPSRLRLAWPRRRERIPEATVPEVV